VDEPLRLVTFAELDGDEAARQPSVHARLELELSGGRRVTVLDDRGWGWSVGVYSSEPLDPAELERQRQELDPWSGWTEEDIAEMAQEVVGEDSDEPSDGQTVEASRAQYWSYLADLVHERGIEIRPDALRALPREVELGERIRARIARAAPPPPCSL
jgi:hypothetical protein